MTYTIILEDGPDGGWQVPEPGRYAVQVEVPAA